MEKTKEIKDYLKFIRKLKVLQFAQERGKNKEACELFGVKKVLFINGRRPSINKVKMVY